MLRDAKINFSLSIKEATEVMKIIEPYSTLNSDIAKAYYLLGLKLIYEKKRPLPH